MFTTPGFYIPLKTIDTLKKIVMFLGHAGADGLVNAATVIYSEEDLFVYAYTVIQPTSFFITNFMF